MEGCVLDAGINLKHSISAKNLDDVKDLVVVKANDLIEASYKLGLTENKLVLLAISIARNKPFLTPETPIEITVSQFEKCFSVSNSSARKVLHEAKESLATKQLTYYDSVRKKTYLECWCWRVTKPKNVGNIEIFFTSTIIKLIRDIDKNFTLNTLSDISVFKDTKYGLRLFELTKKWQNNGFTKKYSIEEFRGKMGVDEKSYKNISALNKNVIEPAIKEINEHSEQLGFTVYCNRISKDPKKVTHLQFIIEEVKTMTTVCDETKTNNRRKKKDEKKAKEINYKLSDKQIYKYARLLGGYSAFQAEFTSNVGEKISSYIDRISEKLKDEESVIQWLPYLKTLGFVPSYKKDENEDEK